MAEQNFKIKKGLSVGNNEIITEDGNLTLPSGANITVGGEALDALPDQAGQTGKYLTTDGSDASWSTITQYTPATDEGASSFLAGDGSYKSISYNDITDNPENVINKETYTATGGQTDFNINHTPGMVDVYLNGIRLTEVVDFSGDGTTVTLEDGADEGDIVSLFAMSDLATYIGALTAEDIGGLNSTDIAEFNGIDFNTTTPPAHQEGRIFYDSEYGALAVYSDITGTTLQVGQEDYLRVKNTTGSTILNGKAVYISGVSGEIPTIALADATSEITARVIGLVTNDIVDEAEGFVTVRGMVHELNTSGLTAGTYCYVSTTPGELQTNAPTYPYHAHVVGGVAVSDPDDGEIYVDVQHLSQDSLRVTGNSHMDGNLTIEGDLTVTGTQSITSQNNLAISNSFVYLNSGDTIGESNTTFTGSGLDDAYFTGHYEGTTTKTYYVKIDGVGSGTGGVDTFSWSLDDFSTTEATGVDITAENQALSENINILFNATTGHTLDDEWSGSASPVNVDTGWFSNYNTGTSGIGYSHAGVFLDVSDDKFKFVGRYDPEPEGTIDDNDSSFTLGTVVADTFEGDLTGNVTANSIVKNGGTSTEFLKADGTTDDTNYASVDDATALAIALG